MEAIHNTPIWLRWHKSYIDPQGFLVSWITLGSGGADYDGPSRERRDIGARATRPVSAITRAAFCEPFIPSPDIRRHLLPIMLDGSSLGCFVASEMARLCREWSKPVREGFISLSATGRCARFETPPVPWGACACGSPVLAWSRTRRRVGPVDRQPLHSPYLPAREKPALAEASSSTRSRPGGGWLRSVSGRHPETLPTCRPHYLAREASWRSSWDEWHLSFWVGREIFCLRYLLSSYFSVCRTREPRGSK